MKINKQNKVESTTGKKEKKKGKLKLHSEGAFISSVEFLGGSTHYVFIELHEGKKCMLVEFRQMLGICGTMLHHTLWSVHIKEVFCVWGESVHRGENINTDTNNVYCKHISICL